MVYFTIFMSKTIRNISENYDIFQFVTGQVLGEQAVSTPLN